VETDLKFFLLNKWTKSQCRFHFSGSHCSGTDLISTAMVDAEDECTQGRLSFPRLRYFVPGLHPIDPVLSLKVQNQEKKEYKKYQQVFFFTK